MHHSIWATPVDPAYDDLITQLSVRFETDRFPAHVTVLKGFHRDDVNGDFRSFAFEPFDLVFDRVELADPSIILRAQRNEAFDSIARAAHERFGGVISEPHLSLLYFPSDPEAAYELVRDSLELPIAIRFSRLELWDTIGPLSSHPVDSWKLLDRRAG